MALIPKMMKHKILKVFERKKKKDPLRNQHLGYFGIWEKENRT